MAKRKPRFKSCGWNSSPVGMDRTERNTLWKMVLGPFSCCPVRCGCGRSVCEEGRLEDRVGLKLDKGDVTEVVEVRWIESYVKV